MAGRAQYPPAFLAGKDRTLGASDARSVQVLRVVIDVEHQYLLRDPVQDVLRPQLATRARPLLASQFFRQPAQARYLVGTKNTSNAHV